MLYTLVLPHFAHVHIDSGLRPGAPENIKEPGEAVASTPVDNDVDETAATARVMTSSAERREGSSDDAAATAGKRLQLKRLRPALCVILAKI